MLLAGHEQVSLKPMYKDKVQTVTLTSDIAAWFFLFVIHCLVTMNICAELFLNPTMHDKVMGRTATGFTEVYAQSLNAICDLYLATGFLLAIHHLVMMIICVSLFLKPHCVWQSYGLDTNWFHLSLCSKFKWGVLP